MRTRRFGKTELDMPVFSCGGMRYQSSWNDSERDKISDQNQHNLEATIRRSLEVGINHIETARGYGTSEYQLGKILPTLPRDEIIVQTKVNPTAEVAEFLEIFNTCMEALQLDHVDLLSLHGINNAETFEWSLRPGGCLEQARKLQREGRTKYVGFSTHGATQIIIDTIDSGGFDYVNLHWYYVNDFNWPAIEHATALDMGVFIISPNDKGGKLYEPPEKLRRLCEPLSPMAFNDLYCLSRPQVHTLSLGASKPSDFDEHVAALEHYDQAEDTIAPIADRIHGEMCRALGADWVAGWWHGIPEHDEVPGNVNLREILRLWGLAKALDLVEFGKMRYNLLGNAGHWFPGENAATFDEQAILELLAGHPFRDRIPEILREAHTLLGGEQVKRQSQQ